MKIAPTAEINLIRRHFSSWTEKDVQADPLPPS